MTSYLSKNVAIFIVGGILFFTAGPNAKAQELSKPILKSICQSECTGLGAKVTPWMAEDGAIKYYSFLGSLDVCSHPPQIFFDTEGNRKFTRAEKPVSVAQEKNNPELKGLKSGADILCIQSSTK